MKINFLDSIEEITKDDWDAVLKNKYPFLKYDFLKALETTKCVSAEQGWSPLHIVVSENKKIIAVMPLYIKTDSQGEFIFDWSEYSNNQFSALCFTLDHQGNIYIGSDSELCPITVVENGSARTLYPSILSPPINYMSWGNSNYLYVINRMSDVNRVQRIDTRSQGADYYGRP